MGAKWILLEPGVDTIQAGDEWWVDNEWRAVCVERYGTTLVRDFPCRRRVVDPVCKREAFSGGGSPSPRECGICGVGPCSKVDAVCSIEESPDDWVTQDRVPARPGIDQRRFTTIATGHIEGWEEVKLSWSAGLMHGDVKCGQSVELRCRRKDLPPTPAKTRTVTLRKFVEPNGTGEYIMRREDLWRVGDGYTKTDETVQVEVPCE